MVHPFCCLQLKAEGSASPAPSDLSEPSATSDSEYSYPWGLSGAALQSSARQHGPQRRPGRPHTSSASPTPKDILAHYRLIELDCYHRRSSHRQTDSAKISAIRRSNGAKTQQVQAISPATKT
uniref:Uncharacterized protein n=1 Tax=Cacopsylla melanoneura TaxID=428564 RepID=A0A8D8RGT4_9HEMI